MFIATLFTIARTLKQPRCPSANEWIKKIHIYNGMLLNCLKKWGGHFSDVEELTVFVLQSEVRKRKTLYINAYIWTLFTEKWYCEPLQGKNRDTHRECTCGHGVGGGRGG